MQRSKPRILVAANPKSGPSSRRTHVNALCDTLSQRGFLPQICESLAEVRDLSHSLHVSDELRCVVAAGGDGTAAAVANLIPQGVPLALLPLGTENLLSKYLKVTSDVNQVTEVIVEGNHRRIDVGLANGRMFLIMLSCGFDAQVVHRVHEHRRGHISRWAYAEPIWRSLRNYSYPLIDVAGESTEIDGDEDRTKVTSHAKPPLSFAFQTAWLFVFNLPCYASNLAICPQSRGDDGQLDLCSFLYGGSLRGIGYLSQLLLRRHQRLKDFRHITSRKFHLSSNKQIPYQIDGDPGGFLPLSVEVVPDRLTLLVPDRD